MMQKRTYLTITPDDRSRALRAAGKLENGENSLEYDPKVKLWYAKEEANLERVKAWLPENTVTGNLVTTESGLTPREEFRRALEDAGFDLSDRTKNHPIMDGKKHRVPTRDDRRGQTSGEYIGYLNGRPAGSYRDYRSNEGRQTWISSGTHTLDPAQRMQERAKNAQKLWDREIARQQQYEQIGLMLTRQLKRMSPAAGNHLYSQRKAIKTSRDIKQDKYGNLVIPLQNIHENIRSVQYIAPDGEKNLKKNAEKMGNYYVEGGPLKNGKPILFAEGYATAVSLNMATGLPVVMTVDAGNLVTVSHVVSVKYPDSLPIICADNDYTRVNNKGERENLGVIKAKESAKAINGVYIIPQFTDEERAQAFAKTGSFSDFNDIHVTHGLDAVRDQLAPTLDPLVPNWRAPFIQENTPMPDMATFSSHEDEIYREYLQDIQNGDVLELQSPATTLLNNEPVTNAPQTAAVEETLNTDSVISVTTETEHTPSQVTLDVQPTTQEIPFQEASDENAVHSEIPEQQPDTSSEHSSDASHLVATAQEVNVSLASNSVQDAHISFEPESDIPEITQLEKTPVQKNNKPEQDTDLLKPISAAPEIAESAVEKNTGDQTTIPNDTTTPAAEPETENALNFTFGRQAGDTSSEVLPINLDELLQGLTNRRDGNTWVYLLGGEDAFRDYGDRIVMASPEASENDRMILAALLAAKANQRGAVEITGSPEFIERTLGLIADHKVEVHLKNLIQREQFEALVKARAENLAKTNSLVLTPDDDSVTDSPTPVATVEKPEEKKLAPVPERPELTLVERETLRTGISGKLLDAGPAPYNFNSENTESYYVKLRTRDGQKTYWGKELAEAMRDGGHQIGDLIKVQYLGKIPVTINRQVKDEHGTIIRYEPYETHRNKWKMTSTVDRNLLVKDSKTVAPVELSAYDGNAFWEIQKRVLNQTSLSLSVPSPTGHHLLYTGPDGQGQSAPAHAPSTVPVPPKSRAAGSPVMEAYDEKGQLLVHLVKGHGDYLQGVVRHENELKHVLARICTKSSGEKYLALNSVQSDGEIKSIGHASAVNKVRGADVNFDTFAFQLKGNDHPKFAVPLIRPEKIPPALHASLGFTQGYVPPKAEPQPSPTPRAQVQPAMQNQPV